MYKWQFIYKLLLANIYIGHHAGANETGSNKFYLGNNATNTLMYRSMDTRQILLGQANPTGYTFQGKDSQPNPFNDGHLSLP